MGSETVLGFVGSPNRDGRTNQLVTAALEGAANAGASIEVVQMGDHIVAACKDCLPWTCQTKGRCNYDDEAFEYLSEKIKSAGALVFGTPVYWGDTTGLVRYFFLKMFRVYAVSAPLKGMPAFGIANAGGSGNGLVTGAKALYHFFRVMNMRPIEPVPATRFNHEAALQRCRELGAQLAQMAKERKPFEGIHERSDWFDSLPYIGLDATGERHLLASLTTAALGEDADPAIAKGMARVDALLAGGRRLEANAEIGRVYDAGIKDFNDRLAANKA